MSKLTKEDWIEIYYALVDKQCKVDNGDYGEDGDDIPGSGPEEWSIHLGHIIGKIGPDGENMYEGRD